MSNEYQALMERLISGDTSGINPESRTEMYLLNAVNALGVDGLDMPSSRIEAYLGALAVKIEESGSGEGGLGISNIVQTTTSSADGGNNVVTITLTDGSTKTFTIKNGSKGSTGGTGPKGDTGATGPAGTTPVRGTDYWTEADKTEIINEVLAAIAAQ